ncbi:pyridoxal-phosphate dependent enzyme [Pseudonocardia sp. KRD-182]|uniref:pyridoxal-phosphate dependent enzyme n=1 Tax=Pseudonocardia oceani TaxID=2792013 RepID=UPI001C49D65A|nr:pyridoxal-phosphate dependent enzyme [Pseudonocardia oceani]MBW0110581.1 pyridoxal-phosphate dependent enzyme [Pseudonocardia oceani]
MSDNALPLGCWPTPVQQVPGHPGLCLKREDLSGLGFGGNKVRAVDAIVTAMRRRSADVLVTGGRRDSNWAALAAIGARAAGSACHLVLDPDDGPMPTVVALALAAGAHVHRAASAGAGAVNPAIADLAAALRAGGDRPFAVPRAGACTEAVWGYATIADELAAHLASLGRAEVWVPAGSGTTAAGLCLGLARAGLDRVRVVAVAVQTTSDEMRAKVEVQIAAAATAELRDLASGRLDVLEPDAGDPSALDRLLATSGVLVDPVFGLPVWRTLAGRLVDRRVRHPTVLVAGGGLPAAIENARHSQLPDAAEVRA